MREIISKHQAAILQELERTVDSRHSELVEKMRLPQRTYETAMQDLRERDLVLGTKSGSKHILRLAITMAGIRALRDYIDHQARMAINPSMAVPARINVMSKDYPAWQPKPMTSCRNDGHKTRRSLGAFA